MNRRALLVDICIAAVLRPLRTKAQPAAKVPRIGYVSTNLTASPHLSEAFRQGLRDLGYINPAIIKSG
jgi:hypothetical protein